MDRSALPSTPWAAITPPTRSSSAPLDWARVNPDAQRHPGWRRGAHHAVLRGRATVQPDASSTPPSRSRWTSIRRPPFAASATRASTCACASSREGKADAVVTAGHTGAGVASAIINLGRLKGVDRPALAVQMVTDKRPHGAARYRRHDRLDRARTSTSTRTMGTIFAEQVLGVKNPIRGAAVASARRAARASSASRRRPSCCRPASCASSATPRARTCPSIRPTWSSATPPWAT